jgi:hypothetical protein
MRLTAPQIAALRILAERDPQPTYPSNRNAPPGGSYIAIGTAAALEERGLALREPYAGRAFDYKWFITPEGRAALAEVG